MKGTLLKYILISIVITFILFFFVILFLAKYSYDDNCLFKTFPSFDSKGNSITLLKLLPSDSAFHLQRTFPYEVYLSSDNWKKVQSIRNDLAQLDSINHDSLNNLEVISIALTKKINFWETNNLDSLNLLLRWTEKFNLGSICTDRYAFLYDAVFNYWISVLSERLDKLNQADYSIQFNCKFRYLRMRCCQLGADCGDRNNLFTKAILNVVDTNWTRLINRFWIGTSIMFKFISLVLVLITGYGYICIIKKHFKK